MAYVLNIHDVLHSFYLRILRCRYCGVIIVMYVLRCHDFRKCSSDYIEIADKHVAEKGHNLMLFNFVPKIHAYLHYCTFTPLSTCNFMYWIFIAILTESNQTKANQIGLMCSYYYLLLVCILCQL